MLQAPVLAPPRDHAVISVGSSSDRALEARLRAGDRAALQQLLRQHAPALLSVCRHFAGSDEARDALQEALVRIVKQVAQFDPAQGSFRTWCFSVTRNVCRDLLRRRGLERAAFTRDGGEEAEQAAWHGPDPEREAVASEGRDALLRALPTLPEEMRTALVLFHVHEASYEEIAHALDVPLGTVMTWLHRGRKRLRAKLEDR